VTGDQRTAIGVAVFAEVFTRERHLGADDRLKAAYEAARRAEGIARPENAGVRAAIERRRKDATAPNDISDERARRIIAAMALKHDTTSADIRASGGSAETVAAREEAACELARAGFSQRAVARLLGRARHAGVPAWIENHEARVAAAAQERQEASHARG
jgi:hypothetical protein